MIDQEQDSRIDAREALGSLDAYINRTLLRDAEALPTFKAVPNGNLTAKLAITTASHGLLRSLGAKLAMYVGVAAMIGGLIYILPRSSESPLKKSATQPHVSLPQTTESTSPKVVETPAPQTAQPQPLKSEKVARVARSKPAMTLDEGDDNNAKAITQQGYHPPIK